MWFGLDDAPGLTAFLYGPSEIQARLMGCTVTVRQDTEYPFEDDVRFEVAVSEPLRMTLRLRRPAWAAAIVLDGVAGEEDDGWIVIDRRWHGRTLFTVHFTIPVRAERYPGSGIAVLRGPLQFVQPIRHKVHSLKTHALAQFQDEELLPVDVADVAARTPVLDASITDLGFGVERDATSGQGDPWSAQPVRLVAGDLILVPMGCAPLRRAMFIARE
jgi:DUF1680 family protein